MHTSAYKSLDSIALYRENTAGLRSWMQKNSAGLRPDTDGCGSVQEGDAQLHFNKIYEKVCIFPQNLSTLDAYDRV